VVQNIRNSFLFKAISAVPQLKYRFYKKLGQWADKNKDSDFLSSSNGAKMLLNLNDAVQRHIFIYGYYEPVETKFWLHYSKKQNVIFDIGANVGYYSLIAATQLPKGRIFAFEPITKTYNRAKKNIELNKFTNIELNQLAMSATNGQLSLNIGNVHNWGMSSINTHDHLSGETQVVTCKTVDSFIRDKNLQELNLVKIDVEGSEMEVLKGMQTTLQTLKPTLLVEVLNETLKKTGFSALDVYSYLWDNGYKAYRILDTTKLELLKNAVSYDGLVCFRHGEIPFPNEYSVLE
jgi:FkbM family methyltransferase